MPEQVAWNCTRTGFRTFVRSYGVLGAPLRRGAPSPRPRGAAPSPRPRGGGLPHCGLRGSAPDPAVRWRSWRDGRGVMPAPRSGESRASGTAAAGQGALSTPTTASTGGGRPSTAARSEACSTAATPGTGVGFGVSKGAEPLWPGVPGAGQAPGPGARGRRAPQAVAGPGQRPVGAGGRAGPRPGGAAGGGWGAHVGRPSGGGAAGRCGLPMHAQRRGHMPSTPAARRSALPLTTSST